MSFEDLSINQFEYENPGARIVTKPEETNISSNESFTRLRENFNIAEMKHGQEDKEINETTPFNLNEELSTCQEGKLENFAENNQNDSPRDKKEILMKAESSLKLNDDNSFIADTLINTILDERKNRQIEIEERQNEIVSPINDSSSDIFNKNQTIVDQIDNSNFEIESMKIDYPEKAETLIEESQIEIEATDLPSNNGILELRSNKIENALIDRTTIETNGNERRNNQSDDSNVKKRIEEIEIENLSKTNHSLGDRFSDELESNDNYPIEDPEKGEILIEAVENEEIHLNHDRLEVVPEKDFKSNDLNKIDQTEYMAIYNPLIKTNKMKLIQNENFDISIISDLEETESGKEIVEVEPGISTYDTKIEPNEIENIIKDVNQVNNEILVEDDLNILSSVGNSDSNIGQKELSNSSFVDFKQIKDTEEKYDLVKTLESEENIFKNKNYFKMASKLDILKKSDASECPQKGFSKKKGGKEESTEFVYEEIPSSLNKFDSLETTDDQKLEDEFLNKDLQESHLSTNNMIDPTLYESNLKELICSNDEEIIDNYACDSMSERLDSVDPKYSNVVENDMLNEHFANFEPLSKFQEPFFYDDNNFIQNETEENFKSLDECSKFLEKVTENKKNKASRLLDTINENESYKKIQTEYNFQLEENDQSPLDKVFTKYEPEQESENYRMESNHQLSNSTEEFCLIENSILEPTFNFSNKKNQVKPPIGKPKRIKFETPSFSNDSLSANSKNGDNNDSKPKEKSDKKVNKIYQPKSLNEVKNVKILSNFEKSNVKDRNSLPNKPIQIKKTNDLKDANLILKSPKPFYLVKNRPILVPPNFTDAKNKFKNEQLPRRVQSDLVSSQRSKNLKTSSKSIDYRASEVPENKVNNKIRVYKTKRWTSESPVKNYINSGTTLPMKKSPLEEVNYYNRISLIKNKINQLTREYPKSTRIEDIQINKTNKNKPLINNFFQGPLISNNQKSDSFLFGRKIRTLNQNYHQELNNGSFEFLKNFFYLNERLKEEKFFENFDFQNYSSHPFKKSENFYNVIRKKITKFCLNLKWIFNCLKSNKLEKKSYSPTQNEHKLMITDYEDLFRNMKEVDLENKINCQYVRITSKKLKDQKISNEIKITSLKNINASKDKLYLLFMTLMVLLFFGLLLLNINLFSNLFSFYFKND